MRIFYLEDNPLIVFHVEQLIEDLGHTFAGSLDSFVALKSQVDDFPMDVALIDIDLADGRTGPEAARWLGSFDVPCFFLTGQAQLATDDAHLVLGIISKPVNLQDLAEKLSLVPKTFGNRTP
ncbi:MAG: response regulator [Sphingobacteriales bacterium]|nr:MAG: response regulator [Sphingobacteriales bacterium]